MNSISYRCLLAADVPAISRVHRDACLTAYRFMNWSYSEDDVRAWFIEKFEDWDWGLVAVADEVVGFVAVAGSHVDQLFVEPGLQRRGIGSRLVAAALRRSPPPITLTVFEQNTPARRFYDRYGFREVDRFINEAERSVELLLRHD